MDFLALGIAPDRHGRQLVLVTVRMLRDVETGVLWRLRFGSGRPWTVERQSIGGHRVLALVALAIWKVVVRFVEMFAAAAIRGIAAPAAFAAALETVATLAAAGQPTAKTA